MYTLMYKFINIFEIPVSSNRAQKMMKKVQWGLSSGYSRRELSLGKII